MSVTIGRASLDNLYDLQVRGRRVSFRTDIEAADVYEMQAVRQQLAGLVDNRDEEVVPFTWSEDATLDGFYRVVSVDIPSTDVQLVNGYIPDVQVELEQIPGFANPWFEVTTQSVVRTNGHGITAADGIVATELYGWETDLRPALSSASGSATYTSDASAEIVSFKTTAPLALTSMRFSAPASNFYAGACRIEVQINGTWYVMNGRQIPAGYLWRISNGIVRLTPATSTATNGTFEVWDELGSASWESKKISHWSNGSVGINIGFPGVSVQPTPVVLRNSPEEVVVKVASSAGRSQDFTYRIQRGARLVSFSHSTATAVKMGIGYAGADFTLSTSFTGGIATASNDSNGNRLVFGMAGASSYSASGGVWLTTAATSSSGWVGADRGGAGVTTELRDEFLAACSWRQRVVIR